VVQVTVLQGCDAVTLMLPRNLLHSSSGVWRSKKNIRRGKVYKFSMTGLWMTGGVGRSIRGGVGEMLGGIDRRKGCNEECV
jgi:hypothetical protein